MAGGHDQLWKDLIQAFPADFVRLVGPDLAVRLLGPIEFRPVEAPSKKSKHGAWRRACMSFFFDS
jgi:hypothetical protein